MSRARSLMLLLVVGTLIPSAAPAQQRVLGSVGLGRPLRPLDARARAMGGAAVSLHGANLSAVNPAAAARISTSGAWVTLMPENRTVKGDVASGEFKTADFPLVRVAWPAFDSYVVSIGFAGFLDRDWGIEFIDTLRLSNGDVAFRETRTADGGISQFRLEVANVASEKWALGAAFQYLFGESRFAVRRVFNDTLIVRVGDQVTRVPEVLNPYESTAAFESVGWGLTVGAEYQPVPEMIFGAVVGWGPGLEVRKEESEEKLDLDLPLTLDLGASWQLTPDFILALALGWENWSSADDELPGGASDIYRAGVGVEYRAIRGATSSHFVRLGGHFERYPFTLGGGWPWERGLSFGVGSILRNGRGRLDGTVEFGRRAGLDEFRLQESYTRYSFSLAVFTN